MASLVDQIEARFQKAKAQVDQLTPVLSPSPGYGGTGLARAIAGKLVRQNPTDESASALIERLREQKPQSERMPQMKQRRP